MEAAHSIPTAFNRSVAITVDFIPRGAKTAAMYDGLFKELKVNRGFAMPLASDGD